MGWGGGGGAAAAESFFNILLCFCISLLTTREQIAIRSALFCVPIMSFECCFFFCILQLESLRFRMIAFLVNYTNHFLPPHKNTEHTIVKFL